MVSYTLIIFIIILVLIYIFTPKSKPKMLMDFTNITLPNTSNYFLICPIGYCNVAVNEQAPIYPVSVQQLNSQLQLMLAEQERLKPLASDESKYQYTYLQRTKLMRYPDYINIQLIKIDDSNSSIAIFSQSKYGHSDLGMNQQRVNKWLDELAKQVNNIDQPKNPL